jgi:hypothetical protein
MTQRSPSPSPTPAECRPIRRHVASAAGAHLFCRRGACRRARACRQTGDCLSTYNGQPDGMPADQELWAFQMSYLLKLFSHWQRLPPRPARRARPPRAEDKVRAGRKKERAR